MNLNILILVAYFNRPRLVQTLLRSIKEQDYNEDNYDVAFIDDSGSDSIGYRIWDDANLSGHYVNTEDTEEAKVARGGSNFGKFWNQAMQKSDADIALMGNDDDFLDKNYLSNLNNFFKENPAVNYCYSDVILYNPLEENYDLVVKEYEAGFRKVDHAMFLNSNKNPHPLGNSKDSSQVAWRLKCFKEGGCQFPAPHTRALDFVFFSQLYEKYGVGHYSGFLGQFKGWGSHQLGSRSGEDTYYKTE